MNTKTQSLQVFARISIKTRNVNILIISPKTPIQKGAKQVQKGCKNQEN